MASQWQHMRFTYTEANLLPDDHPYNLEYNEFLDIFGEEGNLIVLGVKDSTLFTPENFNAWMKLSQELQAFDEVELSLSVGDLKKLQKRKFAYHRSSIRPRRFRATNVSLQFIRALSNSCFARDCERLHG